MTWVLAAIAIVPLVVLAVVFFAALAWDRAVYPPLPVDARRAGFTDGIWAPSAEASLPPYSGSVEDTMASVRRAERAAADGRRR